MADTKINGALFQSMVTEGALAITEQKEQINELNVFRCRTAIRARTCR